MLRERQSGSLRHSWIQSPGGRSSVTLKGVSMRKCPATSSKATFSVSDSHLEKQDGKSPSFNSTNWAATLIISSSLTGEGMDAGRNLLPVEVTLTGRRVVDLSFSRAFTIAKVKGVKRARIIITFIMMVRDVKLIRMRGRWYFMLQSSCHRG